MNMMIHPRFLARALAWWGGYFWLPCPICNEPFAGFEWGSESLHDTPYSGTGVCSKQGCIEECARRNARRFGIRKTPDGIVTYTCATLSGE
jgi:hypothetical protein